MNLINASNKIGKLLSLLRYRMEELQARKAEVLAELRPLEKANSRLSDHLDKIDMEFADTDGMWSDMINDGDDQMGEMSEKINDLRDEIDEIDDKISAINYAFENALGELSTGIFSSK